MPRRGFVKRRGCFFQRVGPTLDALCATVFDEPERLVIPRLRDEQLELADDLHEQRAG
jgi:hypothetical protein